MGYELTRELRNMRKILEKTVDGRNVDGRNGIADGSPWHKWLGAVILALVASSAAQAQLWYLNDWPQLRTVAQLGTCTTRLDGAVQQVRDALTVNTCATGGGTANALCICDAEAWRVLGAVSSSEFTTVDAAGDTTTFPVLAGAATGAQAPLTDAGITYQATTNALTTTTFIGALTGNASTATLATTATTGNAIRISATAPSVCDVSTSLGMVYIDTTGPDLCYCPGTAGWTTSDGSGTCA